MDFFAHQDLARRRTWLLLPLSVFSVVGTALALYPIICIGLFIALSDEDRPPVDPAIFFNTTAFTITTAIVFFAVVWGIFANLSRLRSVGGSGVAERLGGQQVQPNSANVHDRRLLNVVEEMAIASGVPVPPVYLMANEPAINAFAAGWTPRTAVIGVTEGTRQHLSRDELQGVMAHEFSHILNGDMRLNMYLSAVVGGINVIQMIGSVLLEMAGNSARYSSHRTRKDDGNPLGALMIVGFGMMVVGFVGAWFARLTQSAISRQREFLADASAVQFTRNPDGIGNALKKIGALATRGSMHHPQASASSHLFFSAARVSALAGFSLRTHPPIPERIKRILPSWDGSYPEIQGIAVTRREQVPFETIQQLADEGDFDWQPVTLPGDQPATTFKTIPLNSLLEEVAIIDDPHINASKQLLASLPPLYHAAARDPHDAQAVALALVMPHLDQRDRQRALVQQHLPDSLLPILDRLLRVRDTQIAPAMRLPLAHLVESALRNLSANQFSAFRNALIAVVEADEKIDWFEWCLLRVILDPIEREHREWKPPNMHVYGVRGAERETKELLRLMILSGYDDPQQQASAWKITLLAFYAKHWPKRQQPVVETWQEFTNTRPINDVIASLARCSMNVRREVLLVLSCALAHDAKVTVAEAELFAALIAALDAPAAPVLAS